MSPYRYTFQNSNSFLAHLLAVFNFSFIVECTMKKCFFFLTRVKMFPKVEYYKMMENYEKEKYVILMVVVLKVQWVCLCEGREDKHWKGMDGKTCFAMHEKWKFQQNSQNFNIYGTIIPKEFCFYIRCQHMSSGLLAGLCNAKNLFWNFIYLKDLQYFVTTYAVELVADVHNSYKGR